jgi:GNAT superfamily N-acetyltransferase
MFFVRPATAADRPRIEAMHAACSLQSRIDRWHGPLRAVPARYLDDAVSGRPGHVCTVATDGRDVVGFASAVRGFGGCWDIGVLVRDDVQRRGIGGRLIAAVTATARERGAVAISADLSTRRAHLLDVFGRYGSLETSVDQDGIHARVELAQAPSRERVAGVGDRLHVARVGAAAPAEDRDRGTA